MAIHKIKIFSGRGSEYLAEKIAASFGTTLGQSEVLRFSDGEFQPCYNDWNKPRLNLNLGLPYSGPFRYVHG